MDVKIKRLTPDTPMPEYKTSGACAFDIAVIEGGILQPNERRPFRTGLVVKVPEDHILLLAPRSSNAKKGVVLANGIGYIDRDYCGPEDELRAFLHNIGNEPYTVEKGERIMQGTIVPCPTVRFLEEAWGETKNRGGFGTTG